MAYESKYGTPVQGRNQYGEPYRGRAFLEQALWKCQQDECLIWPFARNKVSGYAVSEREYVHRVICEQVHGPCPPGHETAHTCGKGHLGCINPRHVVWKTPSANQMDRVEHGTSNRGERNRADKLTESQVRAIRAAKGTCVQRVLAERYDVSIMTISDIQRRYSWKWLD